MKNTNLHSLKSHIALIAMCFVALFSPPVIASAQTASPSKVEINVVEALPSGEFIVRVNGIEQRTITAEHARSIASDKAELASLREVKTNLEAQNAQLQTLFNTSQKDAQLAATQAALERERAGRFSAMYDGEQALRFQSERLHGRGRVSQFFENPFVQVGVKLGVPAIQTWVASRQ